MVGKVLGTMVSLPIKLATGILGGTANMFNKRHVRKSEMKKIEKNMDLLEVLLKHGEIENRRIKTISSI